MDDSAQTPQPTPVVNPQQPVVPVQGGQQATRQIEPPPTVGRHPEQAPMRVADAAPVESEPEAATGQAASDVQDVPEAPVAQEAQPQVEISRQLQEAGVEPGPDADKDQLPGEQQQVDLPVVEESSIVPPTAVAGPMPMDYTKAVATQKTSKIRDSLKWMATLIKYQWEKFQSKG